MKKVIVASLFAACMGILSLPLLAQGEVIKLEAIASFYADDFHGKPTSSGEIFDMHALTAAHKTLPFGTMLEVTNLANGRKVFVRVNDRGPFVEGRELDVSKGAAQELGMLETGTARVSIRKIADNSGIATATIVAKETKVDGRWRIQLGSFTNEDNATRLVMRLRSEGFNPAFEKSDGLTRVVLSGIAGAELDQTKGKLHQAGHAQYLVRQERP